MRRETKWRSGALKGHCDQNIGELKHDLKTVVKKPVVEKLGSFNCDLIQENRDSPIKRKEREEIFLLLKTSEANRIYIGLVYRPSSSMSPS